MGDAALDAQPQQVRNDPAETSGLPHKRLWFWLRITLVRLRFLCVFLAAALIVGQWELLRGYWGKLTRGTGLDESQAAVSGDTEYFCPMDQGVLSGWPGKCSICNMALVRREKGKAGLLPSGVLARMQLSPYRIELAGIRAAPIEYRSLVRNTEFLGRIEQGREPADDYAVAEVLVSRRDRPLLIRASRISANLGSLTEPIRLDAEVVPNETQTPHGAGMVRVRVKIHDPDRVLAPEMLVTIRAQAALASLEPFRSQPRDPPKLAPSDPREVYACPDHPEVIRQALEKCPYDRLELVPRPLADNQRVGWWCPMHEEVVSDKPNAVCEACGGMVLVPRIISYCPRGQVLAVPESSVVETGEIQVVYVERSHGMFDAIEVALGPKCGGYYPVIGGLDAGQRVALAGVFLLDAETRLNPNAAAAYFGATPTRGAAGRP